MRHVDEAQAHAYLDGETEWLGIEPSDLESHLRGCAECRVRLEQVRRVREHGRALLGDGERAGAEPPPFAAVVARSRGGQARPGSVRRRFSGAALAASVVVALIGGWLAREAIDGERSPLDPAPVAMDAASTEEPVARTAPAARPEREPDPAVAVHAAPERIRPHAAAPSSAVPSAGRVAEASRPEPVASAQQSESERSLRITGRVTDPDGRPVSGAQVAVRGTNLGTLSAADGSYALVVGDRAPLASDAVAVTAVQIGFESESQEVPVEGTEVASLNFQLQPAPLALEEGVVTGSAAPSAERARAAAAAPGRGTGGLAVARQALGREVPVVPGLPVLDVVTRSDGAEAEVLVRQDLGDGAVLTLVVRQVAGGRGEPATAREPGPRAAEPSVVRDGLRIVGRAPVAADSLRALLETLK